MKKLLLVIAVSLMGMQCFAQDNSDTIAVSKTNPSLWIKKHTDEFTGETYWVGKNTIHILGNNKLDITMIKPDSNRVVISLKALNHIFCIDDKADLLFLMQGLSSATSIPNHNKYNCDGEYWFVLSKEKSADFKSVEDEIHLMALSHFKLKGIRLNAYNGGIFDYFLDYNNQVAFARTLYALMYLAK